MKLLYAFIFMGLSATSLASWLDTSGKIVSIVIYPHTETILVSLDSSGVDVSACSSKSNFAISADISLEARTRMYSMLLAAQASGRNVVISYSDVGNCEPWGANTNAYRKITRLR